MLFGKSLARVLAERMGFRAEQVVTALVPLPRRPKLVPPFGSTLLSKVQVVPSNL